MDVEKITEITASHPNRWLAKKDQKHGRASCAMCKPHKHGCASRFKDKDRERLHGKDAFI
jgi:hypothetical protein